MLTGGRGTEEGGAGLAPPSPGHHGRDGSKGMRAGSGNAPHPGSPGELVLDAEELTPKDVSGKSWPCHLSCGGVGRRDAFFPFLFPLSLPTYGSRESRL